MALLERDALLAALDRSLTAAAGGSGSLALLAGEAGIGKTSLARAFCDRHRAGTRGVVGVLRRHAHPPPARPAL